MIRTLSGCLWTNTRDTSWNCIVSFPHSAHHCSCFLTVCKLALTSWNVLGMLLSPAHTWIPLWYMSVRYYAACVCAAWGPASPAQAAPSVKTAQLKRWRCYSSTTRAIPQLNVLARVEACTLLVPKDGTSTLDTQEIHDNRYNASKLAVGALIVNWFQALMICDWWVLWMCLKGLASKEKASSTQPEPLIVSGFRATIV